MTLSIKHVSGNTYDISCGSTTVQVQLGNNAAPGGPTTSGPASGGQGTFPGGASGGGSSGSGGTVSGAGGGTPTGLGDLTPGGIATFTKTHDTPKGPVVQSEIVIAASKIEHVFGALRNVDEHRRLLPVDGPMPELVLHWLGNEMLDIEKVRWAIKDALGGAEPKLRVKMWTGQSE